MKFKKYYELGWSMLCYDSSEENSPTVVLVVQRFGGGLVIERSLVPSAIK